MRGIFFMMLFFFISILLSLFSSGTAYAESSLISSGENAFRPDGSLLIRVYERDADTGTDRLLGEQKLNVRLKSTVRSYREFEHRSSELSPELEQVSGRSFFSLSGSSARTYAAGWPELENYGYYHYVTFPLTFRLPAEMTCAALAVDMQGKEKEVGEAERFAFHGYFNFLCNFFDTGNPGRRNTLLKLTDPSSKDRVISGMALSLNTAALGLKTSKKKWLTGTVIRVYLTKHRVRLYNVPSEDSMEYGSEHAIENVRLSDPTGYRKIAFQKQESGRWKTLKTYSLTGRTKTDRYRFRYPESTDSGLFRVIVPASSTGRGIEKSVSLTVSRSRESIRLIDVIGCKRYGSVRLRKLGKIPRYRREYGKRNAFLPVHIQLKHGWPQTVTLYQDGKKADRVEVKTKKAGRTLTLLIPSSWKNKRNRLYKVTSEVKSGGRSSIYFQIHVTDAREWILRYGAKMNGAVRGSRRHHRIIDRFNRRHPDGFKISYHDPWCAAFASASVLYAKEHTDYPTYVPLSAGVGTLHRSASRHRIYHSRKNYPLRRVKAGDFVIFTFYGKSDYHVGIAVRPKNGLLKTIEGNTSGHGYDSICTYKNRLPREIQGYITPKYPKIRN